MTRVQHLSHGMATAQFWALQVLQCLQHRQAHLHAQAAQPRAALGACEYEGVRKAHRRKDSKAWTSFPCSMRAWHLLAAALMAL